MGLFSHDTHAPEPTEFMGVRLDSAALHTPAGTMPLAEITRAAFVRDIVQVVRAGHLDHDAQTAFQCWISEALLQQPTTQQIDRLCRAAGFAGPVDVDTMKQRVDALQATINGLRRELSECITQRAALYSAGQTLVERWAHGELAQAVQTLATLLPSRPVVNDEAAAETFAAFAKRAYVDDDIVDALGDACHIEHEHLGRRIGSCCRA